MPQQEGSTDYKYEDYSTKVGVNRLPPTAALVGQTMRITLESGESFKLEFADRNKVVWQSGEARGTDWCEVIEVAAHTHFIDMTFADLPRQSLTFIVNAETRRVLAIRTIMRQGDVGKEPRAAHEFLPGVLGDPAIPPAGRKPAPTRDLIGLRGLYDYGPEQCFEHLYLNSERYAWQCIIGPLRGQADVDFSTVYKFDDNRYISLIGSPACPSRPCSSTTGTRLEAQASSSPWVRMARSPTRLPARSSRNSRSLSTPSRSSRSEVRRSAV